MTALAAGLATLWEDLLREELPEAEVTVVPTADGVEVEADYSMSASSPRGRALARAAAWVRLELREAVVALAASADTHRGRCLTPGFCFTRQSLLPLGDPGSLDQVRTFVADFVREALA